MSDVEMAKLRSSHECNVLNPNWYATYTAPRHEKRVFKHLQSRTVDAFLPLYAEQRNWNGRRAIVQMPLFPGYLFVHIRSCDRMQVLDVPGVIRIVGFDGHLTPVCDTEVEALKTTLQTRNLQPHPLLAPTNRVRIKAGALAGLEGVIVRQAREVRLVVSINAINRCFSVELDAADLERVTPVPAAA